MDIGGILKARRVRRDETLEDVAFRGVYARALEMSLTELFEELEGKAKTPHLRDPASAFDKDTRQLIELSDKLNTNGRRLLVDLAARLAETKGLY